MKKSYFLAFFAIFTVGFSLYFIFLPLGDDFDPYSAASSGGKKKAGKSFLSTVDYFYDQDEGSKIYLNGETLVMYDNGTTGTIIGLTGKAYLKNNQEVNYQANEGFWDRNANNIDLKGEVKMHSEGSFVEAKKAHYDLLKEILVYEGEVKTKNISKINGDTVFINSDKAVSHLAKKTSNFKNNVFGHVKRKRIYEESVHFKSDALDLDLNTHIIKLDGSVNLKNQGFTAEALRGEIHLKDYNKKLKYYALFDDVKLQQELKISEKKKILRKAFAEKLEGIMSEDKIILTGNPKVFQEKDVVKGNTIILRGESETVEVDDAITNVTIK